MAFTKVKELELAELLALAFSEFKQDSFISNKLTNYLCVFLGEPFQPGKIAAVDDLLRIAVSEQLVDVAPGPRGGLGYRINQAGIALISEVDLPTEKFTRRDELDDERSLPANSNAGPILDQVLQLISGSGTKEWRERTFVEKLRRYWLDYGWLSRKQTGALVEIAATHGLYVEGRHYVGKALAEWCQPYLEAELRQRAEMQARAQAAQARILAERQEHERALAGAREINRHVKAKLTEVEQAGLLDCLEALVTEVFPGTSISASAKATAFAGHGSQAVRVCVAALAFGRPPSEVWEAAGSLRQPDRNSVAWSTLTTHPAFVRLGRQLSPA